MVKSLKPLSLLLLVTGAASSAWGATTPAKAPLAAPPKEKLLYRLSDIRSRILSMEKELLQGLRTQKEARGNIKRIRVLMQLQREEREMGRKRMADLERTIKELESRRQTLRERIRAHQALMRKSLIEFNRSVKDDPKSFHLFEAEVLEAPRRKVLANLVERSLKEIEGLRIDLADADVLETRIQEEKQQLAYLFQDLKEKEGVLELNRQLQADLLKRKHEDRAQRLENYQKLKSAEAQVETLITEFNSRLELERAVETERTASRDMMKGSFAQLKGTLPLPIQGRIISGFGRIFDEKSQLHVFKKGIDISATAKAPVRAISAGKIAYSGELPNYGRLTIIDHGNHYYSLCANLGELQRKTGEWVAAGDPIGLTDDAGTPVYFEIRARNVAVNPLQWISN